MEHDTNTPRRAERPASPIGRKLARMQADLAPEDDTFGQAMHTASLREDGVEYIARWVRHTTNFYRCYVSKDEANYWVAR